MDDGIAIRNEKVKVDNSTNGFNNYKYSLKQSTVSQPLSKSCSQICDHMK